MPLYSRDSDPSKPLRLSDPSPEELLAQLSINPTLEQLKEIIKRLHADNKALHTLHDQAVERGDEETDAYQEEREKKKEARREKAELQGKFDELQGNYDSQAEELKKYKGLTATHFQRAQDAELELATRDNELKEARERIVLLERQGVQTTDHAAIAQVQAQEDVDMQMNHVEMDDE
jgi:chromosome segregation ATPase